MNLSLAQAKWICEAALLKGREFTFAPLTVAVLDGGGTLVCLMREDYSALLRPEIAIGKAWGTLGMGFGGRELQRRSEVMPHFVNSLAIMSGGRVVPVPGGVLVKDGSGLILGAVGVSGDTSANDELCAIHGVIAAGLYPDSGSVSLDEDDIDAGTTLPGE
ncbi:heme-binding protein [Neorhizobium sp. T7_12]|uniref:GlcG/HbpS family heme-binding protein n=1 Tax=Neorhizobium sp. T7_12 TaxID=2093832 RepID=UPI000CF8BC14|nr:heme-binding protein [Neorhizobium sp. T7_12]